MKSAPQLGREMRRTEAFGDIVKNARVMGMKEDTVRNVGFARLAIFRPGIIVGNAHTPAWVVEYIFIGKAKTISLCCPKDRTA